MKKLLALLLAVACVLSLNVAAFAAAYDIYTDPVVGTILNGDGESAYDSGYDTLKPGDDYYYIIGPSSVAGYDILTDKDVVRFSMKKKTNGKLVSGCLLYTSTYHLVFVSTTLPTMVSRSISPPMKTCVW